MTEDIMSGEQQHGCVTLRGGAADLLSVLIIYCLARHGVRWPHAQKCWLLQKYAKRCKLTRSKPEPVKQLMHVMYPSCTRYQKTHTSTRKQPISKLKINPNRYILKLSDVPKKARRDPEFVKQLIYLIHPSSSQGIKSSQLNCSTRTQPINKLKIDPHRYNLYLLYEPKNTINGPEHVK